jgi:hypothetical protein
MVNKFNNTKAYMRNFSEELVRLLVLQIERTRQRGNISSPIDASGKLKASLEVKYDEQSGQFVYSVLGNDYGLIVDEGRGAGKMPPINKIIEWIDAKPVTLDSLRSPSIKGSITAQKKKLAFAIARKIGAEGTRPTGFVKQALASAMDKLKIEEPIVQDIEENIGEILIKAGFKELAENEFIFNK